MLGCTWNEKEQCGLQDVGLFQFLLLSGNEHDGVEKPVAVRSTRPAEPRNRSLEKSLEAVEH